MSYQIASKIKRFTVGEGQTLLRNSPSSASYAPDNIFTLCFLFFDEGYEAKQPVAWKEYYTDNW